MPTHCQYPCVDQHLWHKVSSNSNSSNSHNCPQTCKSQLLKHKVISSRHLFFWNMMLNNWAGGSQCFKEYTTFIFKDQEVQLFTQWCSIIFHKNRMLNYTAVKASRLPLPLQIWHWIIMEICEKSLPLQMNKYHCIQDPKDLPFVLHNLKSK